HLYIQLPDYTYFLFNAPATTQIYTLSLHDALPISARSGDDSINEKSKGGRHDGSCARSRVRSRATLHNGRRHRVIGAELSHAARSEEHTSELQSRGHLVCRLLLEKKKKERRRNTCE